MTRRFLVALSGAVLAAIGLSTAGGGVGVAAAETVRAGNLIMTVDGYVRPARLPRRGYAPASLTVSGKLREASGEHPQPLQRVVIDFDKAGRVFNRGLPTCNAARIENTTTKAAMQACGRALVGRGRANAQVKFPDQDSFQAPAPLLIFNSPGRGRQPGMLIHAYAFVPLPTTFVVPVHFVRSPNRRLYHHRVVVPMPAIAGGHGSLTGFITRVFRRWYWRGRARSFVNVGCPRGVHRAEGLFRFRGGPVINASVARRCIPRR